jgi:hypothetical protein
MTSTDFLKQKGLIAPAQSQFIIRLSSGSQFNLATLLDEYLQGKTNTESTANNLVSYNLDNLQTVTIPPTDLKP